LGAKRELQEALAGRLRKCFLCGTNKEEDLRNKTIVAICRKCQRLKDLGDKLQQRALWEPKYKRMLSQLLQGKSLEGEIVETGIRIIHLGKVMLLICRRSGGVMVEQLRPDGKGRYIREQVFLPT
jgi:hypothetical protein